jgi:arylsulfatase A-like enzyme
VDGISLAQALRGEGPVRDSLYLAYRDRHRGVRTPTHKLIEYVVDGRHTQTQLFDLKADPLEQRNLAVEPAQSERLRELRKAMIRLRDVWEDDQSPWGRVFWPIFENSLE